MTIAEAEIKQNEFAEEHDKSKAYPAGGLNTLTYKKVFLKTQKIFMADRRKLSLGLKIEYYHFLV